jgi:hypothetical protein
MDFYFWLLTIPIYRPARSAWPVFYLNDDYLFKIHIFVIQKATNNRQLTTNNCTGEAFGELFLAMTDNLSSKCFAPTDNWQLTTDN